MTMCSMQLMAAFQKVRNGSAFKVKSDLSSPLLIPLQDCRLFALKHWLQISWYDVGGGGD